MDHRYLITGSALKRQWAYVLIVLLALPAAAQFSVPTSRPVLRVSVAAEPGSPDAFDADDDFRRRLLDPKNSDRWFVPTELGGALLIVEKGYLNGTQLDRVASDLQEAVSAIPRLTGEPPKIRGRFTVYLYEDGPISEANVPGALPGEKGLMLAWSKDEEDPLFHEMTHLLADPSVMWTSEDSQSLSEGSASWVQGLLRPGRAAGFAPADADPDRLAQAALAKYSSSFLARIGAPGRGTFESREQRFDFYYCSWSFTRYLIQRGGVRAFWGVLKAGGAPEAYARAYGTTYDALIADWVAGLSRA